ncbi:MAG TPA: hypothetical protein VKU60_05080 [Chloroflexota bacterium]|nr:hypothetical protein [Chloroflexota bacterium]
MKLRLVLVLLVSALYSGAVISLNSVLLPTIGSNGFFQINAGSLDFLAPPADTTRAEPSADRASQHVLGAARLFDLWLRPFGVHHPGTNDVWWSMGGFAVLGTVATMLLFIFPKRVLYVSKLLRAEPLGNHVLNLALGITAYALGYALLRLSWLTIVGLPFIPFLIGGVWLATMGGVVIVSFTLVRVALRRLGLALPPLAEALLGLWLLFVSSMLPILGWVIGGLFAAVGFGALLQTSFGSRQRWSLELLEEDLPEPAVLDPKILPLRRAR